MMASCHHSKFIFIILFLIQILFNSILCPLPPPTRHLARNVIRIVLNLPEQPFSQHLNHNTSHEFKQTAENINEAFNLFWQTEPSYRGSRVIRLRYNQVLGTIATIDLIFELPLNTSIAVLHRPFSSPTLACPDGSLPEFSIHGSTYCWSHSVCPSGTACEHGQCCKNAELTPRRNCDPIKEWECADGLCIPISFRCDGKEDCVLDVEERAFALGMLLHRPSDELYCPTGKLIV
uniref:SEA domain-containing protein n=1 Tax=Meloidogyne hapla TaxID=6305 RepID=A0A1I8BFF6_MELHA